MMTADVNRVKWYEASLDITFNDVESQLYQSCGRLGDLEGNQTFTLHLAILALHFGKLPSCAASVCENSLHLSQKVPLILSACRQVKEAIPVPLDGLQNVVRNARQSTFRAALPTTEAFLEG